MVPAEVTTCPRCDGKGHIFVVCYALGVVSCPSCGDPSDTPGATYSWRYDESGMIAVDKRPFVEDN